jgi:exodeoxyribonuclease III
LIAAEPALCKAAINFRVNIILARDITVASTLRDILKFWSTQTHSHAGALIDHATWTDILRDIEMPIDFPQSPNSDFECGRNIPHRGYSASQLTQPRSFATWNVDGFQKRWRSGDVQRAVVKLDSDVIHLTETRTDMRHIEDITEVKAFLIARGYRCVYWSWCTSTARGGYGYAGSTIFSRVKPSAVTFGLQDDLSLDDEGRVITAVFDKTTVIGCYSPCSTWGESVDVRRAQFDKSLTERLVTSSKTQLILLGDLNVAPENRDVQKPDDLTMSDISSCKPFERSAFKNILRLAELKDVYRHYNPRSSSDSWTWSRSKQSLAMRIDHVLCSHSLLGRNTNSATITGCDIVNDRFGSDHRPLSFQLQPEVIPIEE